ncbi:hypothetical protein [Achromobacter aegrifaciens]
MDWRALAFLGLIGGVLIALISASLGWAAGASGTIVDYRSTWLPLFDAMGGWVSGIGTFAAVCATVWFSLRQRADEQPRITVSVGSYGPSGLTLSIVNHGKLPAYVTGVWATSATLGTLILPVFIEEKDGWRFTVNYGDRKYFSFSGEMIPGMADWILENDGRDSAGIVLLVSTTTKEFRFSLPPEWEQLLDNEFRRRQAKPSDVKRLTVG